MKKRILLLGALVGAFLLASCSGGNKKQVASSATPEELDDASKVINYYHTSLIVLRHVANAKDINAVLGYMEHTGKSARSSSDCAAGSLGQGYCGTDESGCLLQ